MHKTISVPHTMLSSRKRNKKSQFQDNYLTGGWTDHIHRTLLGHGHGCSKRTSQSTVNAIDSKNKIQYISAYPTSLT